MSGSSLPRRARASYTMEFKLELVEKSVQPGACVAQLAREHGINDNLLFTWRQRYRHLLSDDVQYTSLEPAAIVPIVVSDMPLSPQNDPLYAVTKPAYQDDMTCEMTIAGACLRLTGNLSPAILKVLLRELRGGRS
ncbi:IS66-like element accessory protein TnpA [Serratia fonticola]